VDVLLVVLVDGKLQVMAPVLLPVMQTDMWCLLM